MADEEIADDKYMQTMEKEYGVFQPERFHHPHMHDITENARDVAMQMRKLYNSGDKETRNMVHNFEKASLPSGLRDKRDVVERNSSGDELSKQTAWSLFIQAKQRYIGHALDESKDISEDRRKFLQEEHGFDMGGRALFDFHSLMDTGKLKPKGID